MKCYDCNLARKKTEPIGVCHHCSVAVCSEHGTVVTDPILMTIPLAKVVALPIRARALLCPQCLAALEQRHALGRESETDMGEDRKTKPKIGIARRNIRAGSD